MPLLLSIIESVGIPDLSPDYRNMGFEVRNASSLRKGLNIIKRESPDIILAQFIYAPTYGSQLSNFEALYAAMQCQTVNAKLVALAEREELPHLQRVGQRVPVHAVITYPIDRQSLLDCVQDLYDTRT